MSTSRMVPPPSEVTAASTSTPKRSSRCWTAAMPPAIENAKTPIRSGTSSAIGSAATGLQRGEGGAGQLAADEGPQLAFDLRGRDQHQLVTGLGFDAGIGGHHDAAPDHAEQR